MSRLIERSYRLDEASYKGFAMYEDDWNPNLDELEKALRKRKPDLDVRLTALGLISILRRERNK